MPSLANFTAGLASVASVPSAASGANVFAPFATLPNCVGVVVWLFGASVVFLTFGFTKLDCNGFSVILIGAITLPASSMKSPVAFLPTAFLPVGPTGVPLSSTV